MMVETILESSQDFGMSNGVLPQWKRELLQRRAARSRPPAAPPVPPPPPPPPPPTDDDSEELRYGPGIVKRLKSRYLSLALRDAPRRRPSVLRRAASLEHLLDERPPPAPRARAPRPASVAAAPAPPAPRPPSARRDSVKRARSVDALSRLDSHEELAPPCTARAPRPPRRPAPLLRDAERPPPDVVRSTLRKFEGGAARRPAPAARVAAALRGLEAARRSLTPEPSEPDAADGPPPPTAPPPPIPLEPPPAREQSPPEVAPAPSPPVADFKPSIPVTASDPSPPVTISAFPTILAPVLAAVPEIIAAAVSVAPATPQAAPSSPVPPAEEAACAATESRLVSRAALEGISRAGLSVRYTFPAARVGSHLPPLAATNTVLTRGARRVGVIRPMPASPRSPEPALVNGHSTPEPRVVSRIGAAGIERAWSGSNVKRPAPSPAPSPVSGPALAPASGPAPGPWLRTGGRSRAPPAPATSIVFNFSNRKEVPDYVENDGIILRASRRNRFKAGEPGVVVLRAGAGSDSDSEGEAGEGAAGGGPPSPCAVRFLNDNVIINGRSSMPARPDPARVAKLKLQFDDSLTRTFEYPSETSLCEDSPPAPEEVPSEAPADAPATQLADNTHMSSAALSRYTPSKTPATAFQLGVTRNLGDVTHEHNGSEGAFSVENGACSEERPHAVPCGADAARSWSETRSLASDLLF